MRKIFIVAALLTVAEGLQAQDAPPLCTASTELVRTDLNDARANLMRALAVLEPRAQGSGFVRRGIDVLARCNDSQTFLAGWSTPVTEGEPAVSPLPAVIQERSNSAYPRDRNDGAMWNGVGLNAQAQAGVLAKWRFLSAALLPKALYQQNQGFDFPRSTPPSEYRHPYIGGRYQIDLPKRMGPSSFSSIDAGNSYVQADAGSWYAAFSNENLWLGPTQVHSLLMSNSAPGLTHLRLGTRRPIDLEVLRLEVLLLFGNAVESKYFDAIAENDSHLFQATLVSIEPTFLPGLHLGVIRVQNDTARATGQSLGYYLSRIIESPFWDGGRAGLDPSDRQAALYARWVLPESGFETYVEWAREDFPFSFLNLVFEPDYSQVWAAGFQKIYSGDRHLTRVYGEFLHLGQAAPIRGGRDIVRFYATRGHGYTNRGQMLGAGVGPGSDAQTFGFERFDASGRTGVMLERVRYDDDTYYERFSRRYSESRHDVEITGEIRRLHFVGPVEIEAALRLSRRWNRDFISALNDTEPTMENNVGTELSLSWTPRFF